MKNLLRLALVLACALVLGCKGSNDEPKGAMGSVMRNVNPVDRLIVEELSLFFNFSDLKGPIRSITETYPRSNYRLEMTYNFDKQGRLISYATSKGETRLEWEGNKLTAVIQDGRTLKVIGRSSDGYIEDIYNYIEVNRSSSDQIRVKFMMFSNRRETIALSYDKAYRLTQRDIIVYNDSNIPSIETVKFSYNNKNNVILRKELDRKTGYIYSYDEETETDFTYSYDDRGNWTELHSDLGVLRRRKITDY